MPRSSISKDYNIEIIEKIDNKEIKIKLNGSFAPNLRMLLNNLVKNWYIDPLRKINNEGIITKDYFETLKREKEREENIKIIEKIDEFLKLSEFNKENKIRILILNIINDIDENIKLVINLENFYLLGFINENKDNKEKQYFYFKIKNNEDDAIKKFINDLEQALELTIKLTKNNKKKLSKNEIKNNEDNLAILKSNLNYDYQNIKLTLELRLKKDQKPLPQFISYNLKDLQQLIKIIKNLSNENPKLKNEHEKYEQINKKITHWFNCKSIILPYTGSYSDAGLDTKDKNQYKDIYISFKELQDAIKNLSNFNNDRYIKFDLVRIIFITSEAMRFDCHTRYFDSIKSKNGNLVLFKNIIDDIQKVITCKKHDKTIINWKNYTEQLIGGWNSSSLYLEKVRKEIFKNLLMEITYWELVKNIYNKHFEEINWNLELNGNNENQATLIKQYYLNNSNKSSDSINEKELWKIFKITDSQLLNQKNIVKIEIKELINFNSFIVNLKNDYQSLKLNQQQIKLPEEINFSLKNLQQIKRNLENLRINDVILIKEFILNLEKTIDLIELEDKLWNRWKLAIKTILIRQLNDLYNFNSKKWEFKLFYNWIDQKDFNIPIINILNSLIIEKNIDILELLILKNSKILEIKDIFYMPLHTAVMCGNLQIVKLLIKYNINVDLQNKLGYTAFHLAIESNKYQKNNLEIIRILLSKSKNIDIKNNLGYTSLHTAILENYSEAVELLLQNKADPNIKTPFDVLPLDLVLNNKNFEIFYLLAKYTSIMQVPKLEKIDIKINEQLQLKFLQQQTSIIENQLTEETEELSQLKNIDRGEQYDYYAQNTAANASESNLVQKAKQKQEKQLEQTEDPTGMSEYFEQQIEQ